MGAGLPLILPRNAPAEVHASQALAESLGVAVAYDDLDDLAAQLRDRVAMGRRRERAWQGRDELTFDFHADRLVALLRGRREGLTGDRLRSRRTGGAWRSACPVAHGDLRGGRSAAGGVRRRPSSRAETSAALLERSAVDVEHLVGEGVPVVVAGTLARGVRQRRAA